MPLMQACSTCRTENRSGATVCERCGMPLSETEPSSYDQKLIQALHHPIPEMQDMAAILLGQRRNRQALPVLLSRCSKRPTSACPRHYPGPGRGWRLRGRSIACATPGAPTCTRGGTDQCRCPGNTRPDGVLGGLDVLKAPPPVPRGGTRDRSEVGNAQSVVLLTAFYVSRNVAWCGARPCHVVSLLMKLAYRYLRSLMASRRSLFDC